jgi:hypothetical protein
MAPLGPPAPFPDVDLPGLDGEHRPISESWRQGWAVIAFGHSDCETTLRALPFVDRLHHRAAPTGMALAVLQDGAAEAQALVATLGLEMPVRLEGDPYPLARRLGLGTVPTLFLVSPQGRIESVSEAFRRADFEAFGARLGVPAPVFLPGDDAPALRPG